MHHYSVVSNLLSQSLLHRSEHNAKWTMTHGFFAAMGGFAIEFHDNDDNTDDSEKKILNFFPAKNKVKKPRSLLTLTPEGIQLLKNLGKGSQIPNLPTELIKDKSKGSAFAKTLVYLQGKFHARDFDVKYKGLIM